MGGGAVESREWGGVEKWTSVAGHILQSSPLPSPPPTVASSMLLPVTSHRWEEMGSFRFKCLPKKKDPGLSSCSMVSQKKKKNEAAS